MFVNHPAIRLIRRDGRGRNWFRLVDDLVCRMAVNGGDFLIAVPAEFDTDGASIPRLLWWLLDPFGDYYRAAILHDYLYSRACSCSRFLADAIFRDGMQADGVPIHVRVPIYYAVRVFGWWGFRKR